MFCFFDLIVWDFVFGLFNVFWGKYIYDSMIVFDFMIFIYKYMLLGYEFFELKKGELREWDGLLFYYEGWLRCGFCGGGLLRFGLLERDIINLNILELEGIIIVVYVFFVVDNKEYL